MIRTLLLLITIILSSSPTTSGASSSSTSSSNCVGSLQIVNQWNEGFQANIVVPVGTAVTNGWTGTLSFGHRTTELDIWTAVVTSSDENVGQYNLANNVHQDILAAGSQLTMSFVVRYHTADYTGTGNVCLVVSFNTGTATTSSSSTTAATTSASTTISASSAATSPAGNTYDYNEALYKALLFYEAQRSGDLPEDNLVPWRGDSSLNDVNTADLTIDLSGGWHDAGDHVKFGLPMASAASTILHSLVFMKEGYEYAGQYDMALRQIRWPLDYFMKCHQRTDRFYAQVGDGNIDHAYWGRPEEMNVYRPGFWVGAGATSGGADVVGETAAALAAGSIVFKTSDPEYSNYLLSNATSLFELGIDQHLADYYHKAIPNAESFYKSSHWRDELAHAAAWLALAYEGDSVKRAMYLDLSESYLDGGDIWALDWDDKRAFVNLLLYHLTQENQYSANIHSFMQQWTESSGNVQKTPLGLAWRIQWGPLRYSANVANLALLSVRLGINPAYHTSYHNFAETQIHYMLGSTGRSFVVGFGVNPPTRPHHRAASCPDITVDPVCDWDDYSSPNENPQILYGALVGGPDANDQYTDVRTDFRANEVACDYNAGFTGALAGLKYFTVHPL